MPNQTCSSPAGAPRKIPVARPGVRGALLAAATLSLALAGCGGGGAGGGAGVTAGSRPVTQRAEQTPVNHDAYAALGYRLAWRGFPVMTRSGRVTQFDIFDDVLLVQESGNTLTLIETSSGRNRWSTSLGGPLTRFVGNARVESRLLAASDNELFVLDINTGEALDRQGLAVVVNTRPVVSRDVAVFGSTRGEVLGHSLVTRYKLWGYLLRGSIEADPTLVGDRLGVVSQGGDVIVIDPTTGSSTGRARVFAGLSNDPVGGEDAVYVASLDQSVYAFAADGGREMWRHRAQRPITGQPTLHDGVLYVAIPEEGLVAFDALDGTILWKAADVSGRVVGMRDRRLLAWDGAAVHALDPESGDVLGEARLPGVERILTNPFEDGDMYLVTPGGVVSRLVPRF